MASKTVVRTSGTAGGLWFIGWLFTLGFIKPSFWIGVIALLLWPYFLGSHVADMTGPDRAPPEGFAQPAGFSEAMEP